jgi:chromosome segregation ATPase
MPKTRLDSRTGIARSLPAAAGLAAVLAVGACTGTQDPSQAGFFDGAANLASGTYDQRVAQREAAAASAQQRADQLALRAQQLEQQRQTLAAQEASLRTRVQQVNAEVYTQRTRLQDLRDSRQADEAELARLESRLDGLQSDLDEARANPQPDNRAEIARLEREVAELTQVIDEMVATTAVVE